MVDAAEARRVAEESREKSWSGQSFMKDVFLGNFRIDLLERLTLDEPTRPEFWEFVDQAVAGFGKFTAGIAHEVKNPLGGIRGAAQLLDQVLVIDDEESMRFFLAKTLGRAG